MLVLLLRVLTLTLTFFRERNAAGFLTTGKQISQLEHTCSVILMWKSWKSEQRRQVFQQSSLPSGLRLNTVMAYSAQVLPWSLQTPAAPQKPGRQASATPRGNSSNRGVEDGGMKAEERRERKEKHVQVQSVGDEKQAKERMQSRGCGHVIKGKKM